MSIIRILFGQQADIFHKTSTEEKARLMQTYETTQKEAFDAIRLMELSLGRFPHTRMSLSAGRVAMRSSTSHTKAKEVLEAYPKARAEMIENHLPSNGSSGREISRFAAQWKII